MKQKKKTKIGFIQLNGYLKPAEIQLYCHPDTDERLINCIELARAIGAEGSNIEIFTRLFNEQGAQNFDYSRKEQQSPRSNTRIIRLNCGPADKFVNQSKIWKYINEFANNIIQYISLNRVNLELFVVTTPESAATALLLKKKMRIPYIYAASSFAFESFDLKKINEKNLSALLKRNNWHIINELEQNILKYADAVVIPNYIQLEELQHNVFYKKILNNKALNIQRINYGAFTENFNDVIPDTDKTVKIVNNALKNQITEARRKLPAIITDFKSREISLENINNIIKLYSKSALLKQNANLVITAVECAEGKNALLLESILDKYKNTDGICLIYLKDYLNEIPSVYNFFKQLGSVYFNYSNVQNNIGDTMNAAAAGLPLVIKKNLRSCDFTDYNRNGLMFADLKQAEELITYLLNTPNIYEQYSQKSVKRIENNYLWRSLAKKYNRLFESVNNAKNYTNTSNIVIPKILEKFTEEDEAPLKTEFSNIIFNTRG